MRFTLKMPLLAAVMALAIFATYQLVAPTTATATTNMDPMTATLAPDIDIGTAAIEATIEKIARVDKAATTNATPVAVTTTKTATNDTATIYIPDGATENTAQLTSLAYITDRTIHAAATILAKNIALETGPAHSPPTLTAEIMVATTALTGPFKAGRLGENLGSDAALITG